MKRAHGHSGAHLCRGEPPRHHPQQVVGQHGGLPRDGGHGLGRRQGARVAQREDVGVLSVLRRVLIDVDEALSKRVFVGTLNQNASTRVYDLTSKCPTHIRPPATTSPTFSFTMGLRFKRSGALMGGVTWSSAYGIVNSDLSATVCMRAFESSMSGRFRFHHRLLAGAHECFVPRRKVASRFAPSTATSTVSKRRLTPRARASASRTGTYCRRSIVEKNNR